jgi:hypothetical protein
MNRFLIVPFVTVMGLSTARAAELPAGLLDPYLRVQDALASDKMEGIAGDAAAIQTAASRLGNAGAPLGAAAKKLTAAKNITAARAAFADLSTALVDYAQKTGATLGPEVHVAWCPMVDKPWIQKGEDIRNPYYGSSMLTCGAIKE